jgi:hypothetical protein
MHTPAPTAALTTVQPNAQTPSATILPRAAAHQAHYLANHKHESKRARFGPTPPRNHYTHPTSPFLSRSAEDMTKHSPYDSGHDSSYSHASGPGHPPSSRGNSDIDDQVDRYIREQRVATLISDIPFETTLSLPTPNNLTSSPCRLTALDHSRPCPPQHSPRLHTGYRPLQPCKQRHLHQPSAQFPRHRPPYRSQQPTHHGSAHPQSNSIHRRSKRPPTPFGARLLRR